jgi:hypothetical protein
VIARVLEMSARFRGLVILVAAALVAVAVASLGRLELDAIPDLSEPQVILFTEWKGRSPTLVEDQITYPLTSTLLPAPKVSAVRGYSMFGMSFVYVLFEEGTDLYWARSRVSELLVSAHVQAARGRDALSSGPTPRGSAGCTSTRSSIEAASTTWASCAAARLHACAIRWRACRVSPGRGGRRLRAAVPGHASTPRSSAPTGLGRRTWPALRASNREVGGRVTRS